MSACYFLLCASGIGKCVSYTCFLNIRRRAADTRQKISPTPIGPFKGINKEIKGFFSNFYIKFRVQKLRLLAFSRGSGGFRELREAGRKHFHLSWYLSVSVVTSYGQMLNVVDFFLLFL